MNEIYNKAINEQRDKGKPIFLANFRLSKSRFYGNSKVPHKSYQSANKIVCAGYIGVIKVDPNVMFNCLVKCLGGKDQASKEDFTKWRIEEVEIISFHGYSADK